jgi:hypothetical protein
MSSKFAETKKNVSLILFRVKFELSNILKSSFTVCVGTGTGTARILKEPNFQNEVYIEAKYLSTSILYKRI